MRRLLVLAVTAVMMLTAAACGEERDGKEQRAAPAPAPHPRTERARQVAAAWNGSQAEASWRAGYHPMGDWTQFPEGLTDPPLTLRATLPRLPRADAEIKWSSGPTLTAPLVPADTAYGSLAQYAGPGTQLPVTAVKLGTMSLLTTRGPATVPAWLFTVEGHGTPVKRAAVRPSRLPKSPIAPVTSSNFQLPTTRVEKIQGSALTVIVPHGSCDDGVEMEALETPGSVVLSAYAVNPQDGLCRADLKMEPVKVTLRAPLADRVLLDASTGTPVPYDVVNGRSPSWS
ncbi:hypothetical protein [Streptomyces sp. 4F14]|uniref:hypothetical protein n=1 Tax=Streptomyces sp. 4F14 TaxID=3394380 RepID=UPI003A85AB38